MTTYITGDSFELNYSSRFYKYIKSSAITGIIQAGVELITNSDDAYKRGSIQPPHRIDMEVSYKHKTLIVYDQATGLTFPKLIECFGQVGNYTSTPDTRGYFSRGAKDITAIGDVYFTSIKDDKISQVLVNTNDLLTVMMKEQSVSAEDRIQYGINVNGLHVKVLLKDSIIIPQFEAMNNISKYYSMRDIFSNKDNLIHIKVREPNDDIIIYNDRLCYTPPTIKEMLTEEVFTIDGYEGASAKFSLNLLEEASPQSVYDTYMEYGILISSGNAIHEVSTLSGEIRYHPLMTRLIGKLECSHINDLMYDFDTNGESAANPFPILDHSRTYGLNKKHPFVKALFKRPIAILKFILQDLYENKLSDTSLSSDISGLFSDLNLFGESVLVDLVDEIYPYKKIDKEGQFKIITKNNSTVVSVHTESTYNFKTLTDISKDKGPLAGQQPSFRIRFTDDVNMKTCYRIYRINNNIHLELNTNDFLLSKNVIKKADGVYSIINKEEMGILLVKIIAEALGREIIIEKEARHSLIDGPPSSYTTFNDVDKYNNILIPKLYDLIVVKNMIGRIITNDDLE